MPLLPITAFTPSADFTKADARNYHTATALYVAPRKKKRKGGVSAMVALLLATCGLFLASSKAIAQTADNIRYDAATGAVSIDNNAFDIQTGAMENTSNIPLPAQLPTQVRERVAQPVSANILAPNTVDILPDVDYINRAFNRRINSNGNSNGNGPQYTLDADSLQLTTQFDVGFREGSHAYGEGIEVTVFDNDNNILSQESTFIRGSQVTVGPDNQPLPEQSQITVSYGAEDTVELRVLNLRSNGAEPSESGIYFLENGDFIVEDLQNGGDLDFDDGEYVQISGGRGEADTLSERQNISTRTRISETPTDPETRIEESIETEIVENIAQSDSVSTEERDYGQVVTPDNPAPRAIGHAEGARTADDEQLIYNRYTGGSQIRAGSDGLSFTGQLKPLLNNPSAPPTLLSANATFNPFVGDNEAGLTGTLGVTQFLNPTHRLATDAFGNTINAPEGSRPLVEPAGLFTNRRLVGYVPPTPDETVQGTEQIFPTNGIFELPDNQPVVIVPADAETVGAGNAAYTDNVGGLLIESSTGGISFVPQWTKEGHATEPISLTTGEATRAIYALVPQQAGQNLALGETYAVTESGDGYSIASGGFFIISADRQPQNFAAETSTVYAVEDTLGGQNAATSEFNGLQGIYAETFGGDRISTVDVNERDEADARVGNILLPTETIAGNPGQQAYGRTTRAAGFYLGGAIAAGIGNQSDTVSQSTTSMDRVTTELRVQSTVNTFMTPIIERETALIQRTETTREEGTASFSISETGELANVRFASRGPEVVSVETEVTERDRTRVRGEEDLVESETFETSEIITDELIEMDSESSNHSDSYANFSGVQGELALGGIFNFGNTPWTAAANTVRAELFTRDTVIGNSTGDAETGWRVELLFNPFGEVQRAAYQYDAQGNAIPVYRTEAVKDGNGRAVYETIAHTSGKAVNVMVNQFATDDAGDRIVQTVGTGEARGPAIYLRVEDAFNDNDSAVIAGGFQFSF